MALPASPEAAGTLLGGCNTRGLQLHLFHVPFSTLRTTLAQSPGWESGARAAPSQSPQAPSILPGAVALPGLRPCSSLRDAAGNNNQHVMPVPAGKSPATPLQDTPKISPQGDPCCASSKSHKQQKPFPSQKHRAHCHAYPPFPTGLSRITPDEPWRKTHTSKVGTAQASPPHSSCLGCP